MAKEIELEVDGFEVTIKPIDLSLKEDKLDELPDREDTKFEKAKPMKVYRVKLYTEAVAETTVKGETQYEAIERSKESIPPSKYEIMDWIYKETEYIEDTYVNPDNPEEEWEYNDCIMEEYGYEYFDLMNWQLALLQSDDQSTLKRFGVGEEMEQMSWWKVYDTEGRKKLRGLKKEEEADEE